MSEKRFQWNERIKGGIIDEFIVDNLTKKELDEEDMCELLNELSEENEQLKTENTMLKEHQNINCQNCQYFVSDSVSSDCLKREDIGYKGTCIDGMDLHMLAKNCPYY